MVKRRAGQMEVVPIDLNDLPNAILVYITSFCLKCKLGDVGHKIRNKIKGPGYKIYNVLRSTNYGFDYCWSLKITREDFYSSTNSLPMLLQKFPHQKNLMAKRIFDLLIYLSKYLDIMNSTFDIDYANFSLDVDFGLDFGLTYYSNNLFKRLNNPKIEITVTFGKKQEIQITTRFHMKNVVSAYSTKAHFRFRFFYDIPQDFADFYFEYKMFVSYWYEGKYYVPIKTEIINKTQVCVDIEIPLFLSCDVISLFSHETNF